MEPSNCTGSLAPGADISFTLNATSRKATTTSRAGNPKGERHPARGSKARLLTGRYTMTQTSINAQTAAYRANNDKEPSLILADIPGHESLRLYFLEQHKVAARGLLFVVDSSSFQREVKEVTEHLFQLLTDSTVLKNNPPILIRYTCNKQDISMAKSAKLIQQQLEKELNTLRVTRSAAPSTLEGINTPTIHQLGKKGKDFNFAQLPMKVEFVECSAWDRKKEEGDANFSGVGDWLARLA
uniref:Signal recognition particle receptor subunit beta n=1 Tax=Leptobrachium leishanense TaxID=445787 RepID=A0A8C5PXZ4_9ANUR